MCVCLCVCVCVCWTLLCVSAVLDSLNKEQGKATHITLSLSLSLSVSLSLSLSLSPSVGSDPEFARYVAGVNQAMQQRTTGAACSSTPAIPAVTGHTQTSSTEAGHVLQRGVRSSDQSQHRHLILNYFQCPVSIFYFVKCNRVTL